MPPVPNATRILIVRLSSLGDVVRATPCVRAMRRAYPAAWIAMAVDAVYRDLVRNDPHLDAVLDARPAGGLAGAWLAARRAFAKVGGARFDLAVDLQGTRRSAMWMYASGARVRAGRGGWRPGWRFSVSPDYTCMDVAESAAICDRLGIPVDDLRPELHVSADDDRAAGLALARSGIPADGFVVVNPFSRWRSKEWPAERYVELMQRLRAASAPPLVVSGGPAEKEKAAALLSWLPAGTAVSLAGELSLGQSLALFRRARLMITGDSGPMHAAAAVGTRVVALFGPTWPERAAPWGAEHAIVQKMRAPAYHAFRSDADGRYMDAIDADTVFKAVMECLR